MNRLLEVIASTEGQMEKQRHIEWAVRFLVHTLKQYDGKLDVGEYLDENVIELATVGNTVQANQLLDTTFDILHNVFAGNALRRYENGQHSGRVSLTGLEGIAVGIAKNLEAIQNLPNSEEFIREQIESFWQQQEVETFVTPGLRGTVRIQRTVPFGAEWFRP